MIIPLMLAKHLNQHLPVLAGTKILSQFVDLPAGETKLTKCVPLLMTHDHMLPFIHRLLQNINFSKILNFLKRLSGLSLTISVQCHVKLLTEMLTIRR